MGYLVRVERICFIGWLMSIFTTLSYVDDAVSHTSAYVTILFSIFFIGWLILILTTLHASAYVSTRQHTSAYVSVRQNWVVGVYLDKAVAQYIA
jgi:hypothetical protein